MSIRPQAGPVLVGPEAPRETLLADLAEILSDARATYFCLGPKGAVFSVKWPEAYAFGETRVVDWIRRTPRQRAEAVLDWVRRAAEYCRDPKIRPCWIQEEVA